MFFPVFLWYVFRLLFRVLLHTGCLWIRRRIWRILRFRLCCGNFCSWRYVWLFSQIFLVKMWERLVVFRRWSVLCRPVLSCCMKTFSREVRTVNRSNPASHQWRDGGCSCAGRLPSGCILDRESGKRLRIPVRGALAACPEVPGIRSLPGTNCIFDKCLWLRTYSWIFCKWFLVLRRLGCVRVRFRLRR